MTNIIDVKNLSKQFSNKVVVNNVNIQVPQGKICGFLGPNGSGKTTIIRMLCGLLKPDNGTGHCLGYDFTIEFNKIREKVGYMTQKFSFWEDLTVEENLNFISQVFQIPSPKESVSAIMNRFNLANRATQLAGNLSGGWKQRLALSACMLRKPSLLLLDEPTAGVDPKARKEFWDEIQIMAKNGMTVLVSTHYMDEAERCDNIIYIAYGNIMIEGPLSKVMNGFKTLEESFIYHMDKAISSKE